MVCAKLPYIEPRSAKMALHAILKKRNGQQTKKPVAIHPCPTCRAWHRTSKRPKDKNRWWVQDLSEDQGGVTTPRITQAIYLWPFLHERADANEV